MRAGNKSVVTKRSPFPKVKLQLNGFEESNKEVFLLHERNLKEHRERLKKIMQQTMKVHSIRKDHMHRERYLANKTKIHSLALSQKKSDITKENNILFNKLLDISMGKMSNLPFVSSQKNSSFQRNCKNLKYMRTSSVNASPSGMNLHNSNVGSLSSLPNECDTTSLNYTTRKLEKQRIDKENLKLAAKLLSTKSRLNKNKLLDDYKKNLKYKKLRSRKYFRSETPKKDKLPPVKRRLIIREENFDIDNIKVNSDLSIDEDGGKSELKNLTSSLNKSAIAKSSIKGLENYISPHEKKVRKMKSKKRYRNETRTGPHSPRQINFPKSVLKSKKDHLSIYSSETSALRKKKSPAPKPKSKSKPKPKFKSKNYPYQ
ncbi:unnamed protein product [Moneuplotes crassus]|uniref:Uncharacterized protein n=1 Tax=Euplotes crassus TaxID=5936 RepID=A0AAD2CVS5_EUPCR|nr:unnamed protein product [Moneuplotes crassus]